MHIGKKEKREAKRGEGLYPSVWRVLFEFKIVSVKMGLMKAHECLSHKSPKNIVISSSPNHGSEGDGGSNCQSMCLWCFGLY